MIMESTEDLDDPTLLLAERESRKSVLRHQLGAVIKMRGKVISTGYNERRTHPSLGCGRWKSLHAESSAIYNALKKKKVVEGAVLYVYRKNGLISKPCEDCQRLIKRFKIRKVIYTNAQN